MGDQEFFSIIKEDLNKAIEYLPDHDSKDSAMHLGRVQVLLELLEKSCYPEDK